MYVLESFLHFSPKELNSRSRVVEDAVLELIELVLVGIDGGVSTNIGEGKTCLTFDDEDGQDLDDSHSGKLSFRNSYLVLFLNILSISLDIKL